MIHLTDDELGNTYVDKKGIFWEICNDIGRKTVFFRVGCETCRIYEAISQSGLTKILVNDKGNFVVKQDGNNDWYELHNSNGQLMLRIEAGKRYTNEELGRKY